MTNPEQFAVPQVRVEELPPAPVVLDVREDDEWAAGHIDGAVHIPLGELPARLGELPDAEPLIVVCRGGGRSARATAYLLGQGVEATNLDGGMRAWAAACRPMDSDGGGVPRVI